jgi:hypothetical protein
VEETHRSFTVEERDKPKIIKIEKEITSSMIVEKVGNQ